jgi:hypothetical protein|tara:strand:+ start:1014 stop:1238 length:225 start_codon:yes stop_codon:yes gene_type:complete
VKKKSGKLTNKELMEEIKSLQIYIYRVEHLCNSMLRFVNDYMEMSKTTEKMNKFLDKKYGKEEKDGKNEGKTSK